MDPYSTRYISPAVDNMLKVKSHVFLKSVVDVKEEEEFKYTFSIDGDSHKGNHMKEETNIDVNHEGESWVKELMEGEYSHLSVEEHLNALVSLIGMENEGNTIHVVIEVNI